VGTSPNVEPPLVNEDWFSKYRNTEYQVGIQIYDFGEQLCKNCVCTGYTVPGKQGCIHELPGGSVPNGPTHTWVGSTLTGQQLTLLDLSYYSSPAAKGFAAIDGDGSLTGVPGGWLVADTPHALPPPGESGMTCGPSTPGNSRVCSPGYNAYLRIFVEDNSNPKSTGAYLRHVATNAATPAPSGQYRCYADGNYFRCSTIVLSKSAVLVDFDGPTPTNLKLIVSSASAGEYVVFAVPYPASAVLTVRLWGASRPSASSADALNFNYPWFYDAASGHLLVLVHDIYSTPSELLGVGYADGWMEIVVVADCAATSGVCTPTALPPPTIIARVRMRRARALLHDCGSLSGCGCGCECACACACWVWMGGDTAGLSNASMSHPHALLVVGVLVVSATAPSHPVPGVPVGRRQRVCPVRC
jgi:hypothetical protein